MHCAICWEWLTRLIYTGPVSCLSHCAAAAAGNVYGKHRWQHLFGQRAASFAIDIGVRGEERVRPTGWRESMLCYNDVSLSFGAPFASLVMHLSLSPCLGSPGMNK